MVKLKRLKILKYRNVKPGTELHFDDGVNLILGQNASGKTTLLALLSAICRGDFSDFEEEEYDLAADVLVNNVTVTLHASHRLVHADDRGRRGWSVGWEISSTPTTDAPPMPTGWWRFDPARDLLEQINIDSPDLGDVYRFDESLGAFGAATGRVLGLAGPAAAAPAYIEQEYLGREGFGGQSRYIPTAIGDLRHSDHEASTLDRPLGIADLEICRAIAVACDAPEVTLAPVFQERRNEYEFKVQGFVFELTRRDGTRVHHDRLSYGQKRLLAFYYYLACNPAIVIADELVNGLHHRWIESCMKAIGERQAFLTSQNPLLFDYVEFDSVEQVRSRFITCKLEQVEGREYMVWENMSEEDAARFFDAYQAGIEHVGDILITRGMW